MKNKKNLMISFFGIDGSGKSTLLEETKKKLEKKGKKVKIIYMGLGSEHNMPLLKQIMKIISYFRYGHKKQDKNNENFRKQNFRKRGFLWVLGQYSELWLRYRKAKKLSKKNIVLFDRYFYDGLVLSGEKTRNFFKHLTPKPDLSFLISASAKAIWKRKKEAGEKEVERYYQNAEKIKKYFNIKKIQNDNSIKKASEEIWREIKNA